MLPSRPVPIGKLPFALEMWIITDLHRFMGSLSNNSRKLANFAGFYKGIQSAGAAITWR